MTVVTAKENAVSLEQRITNLVNGMEKLDDIVDRYPGPGFTDGLYGEKGAPLKAKNVREDALAMAREGRNLRVGIIGRVKAGKSSLLNALMFAGKDVLPKAATPMTASLTILRYTDQDMPFAEVEYFRPEDVNDMRQLAEEYDSRFTVLLAERQKAAEERAARPGARNVSQPDPERLSASVKRELDTDPRLGGAKDMYARICDAGGLGDKGGKTERVDGRDLADLQGKLANYVGSGGRLTPFTKCLTLYLPIPSLQGVDVVDTPGVNDPVRSREERTMEELHNCDVVFVVSPAGQFLNRQDLDLMGRLTYKDGVREVFLVASQVDGQLFGSERDKHDGRLPDVLQGLRSTLATQASNTLAAENATNQGLDTLKSQLAERLVVTSSVAHALLTQPETEWDDTVRHVWSLLRSGYPAEFAQLESARPHLEAMAGIGQTNLMLEQVRGRKQAITEEKVSAFLEGQVRALRESVEGAPGVVSANREAFLKTRPEDLEEKLSAMQSGRERAIRVANVAVGDIAEDAGGSLRSQINSKADELFGNVQNAAEQSKDYEVEYTDPSFGRKALSFLTFGLVSAERTSTTVQAIDATRIRSELEAFHSSFSTQMVTIVDRTRQGLRSTIETGVLAALREYKVVEDRDIDTSRLAQACRAALREVSEFDDPELPPVPSRLMQNGTLRGSDASRFESAALEYLHELRKAASQEARKLTRAFEERLKAADVGARLFDHYEEQLNGLRGQIQEKEKTLQRYDELLAELKELQRHV
ncbi:dynamin family protein [Stutzerimonas nitrititolerans]|uniref:dynamin family protein n=1 Tax=Stutzerimonas nitrititolerans TaxID=2482751 RepID=UPI0028A725D2|nr:dynamin family protein [Stutzerimonas nitrititolerans]